jgi:hypothetical protein
MPRFRLICRAVLEPGVIGELDRRGIYATTGGATHIRAPEHKRHQLELEAGDEASALEKARSEVSDAGGDASNIEVVAQYDD